jgi:hypothetical protein
MTDSETRSLVFLGAAALVVACPILLALLGALATRAMRRRTHVLPWLGAPALALAAAFPVWAWRHADLGLMLLGYLLVPMLIGVAGMRLRLGAPPVVGAVR